jgi:hypothetical protein
MGNLEKSHLDLEMRRITAEKTDVLPDPGFLGFTKYLI